MWLLKHLKTRCVLLPIYVHIQKIFRWYSICHRKMQSGTDEAFLLPRLELQAASMAVRMKEQIVKEHEMKVYNCNFWSDSTTVLQWVHSSYRKQQMWDTRYNWCFTVETYERYQQPSGHWHQSKKFWGPQEKWVAQWAGLVKATRKWMARAKNLIFASEEENIPSSVFMVQAEETEVVIQWERFTNFKRLLKTVAYVQRALGKHKPATTVVSIDKREKAKAIIFKLLQQEQLGE